jgi:hypothetical protein
MALHVAGCNKESSQPQGTEAARTAEARAAGAADPRYASPAALLQHAKSIVDAPEPDIHAFYGLFHWETPEQQTWMRYVSDIAVPHGNLRREYLRRFPSEKWMMTIPIWFYDIRIPRTDVTQDDGQRAQGVFSDGKGATIPLHMVKKDDRWWISGYSLERAGKMDALQKLAADSGQSLEMLLLAAADERSGVMELTARLHIGDIKTVQQFWQAAKESFGISE